jgi:hypothetical protein
MGAGVYGVFGTTIQNPETGFQDGNLHAGVLGYTDGALNYAGYFQGGKGVKVAGTMEANTIGVGTVPQNAELDVNGNVRIRGTATGLPAADAAHRGVMYYLQGGAGTTDKLYVCMKTSADAYQWVMVARGD